MKMLRVKRGNSTLEPIISRYTHHGSPSWPEVFCIAEDACKEQLKEVATFGKQYADHVETCGFKAYADGVRAFLKEMGP